MALSISYLTERFNCSLQQMLTWYKDFQDRTEKAFQFMNHRIDRLENRGPSDEQVERVLRKILAEKFGNGEQNSVSDHSNGQDDVNISFVRRDVQFRTPSVEQMDMNDVQVNPNSFPSEAWRRDLDRLTHGLKDYPDLEHGGDD